jgi:hypothetical protein
MSLSPALLGRSSVVASSATILGGNDETTNKQRNHKQANLNFSSHVHDSNQSSSDDEDDYSVDEELEEVLSITANQYLPKGSAISNSQEINVHFSNNSFKRRSGTTKKQMKYMMYQFDNDHSNTKEASTKSNNAQAKHK